jgi:hypothetical protein
MLLSCPVRRSIVPTAEGNLGCVHWSPFLLSFSSCSAVSQKFFIAPFRPQSFLARTGRPNTTFVEVLEAFDLLAAPRNCPIAAGLAFWPNNPSLSVARYGERCREKVAPNRLGCHRLPAGEGHVARRGGFRRLLLQGICLRRPLWQTQRRTAPCRDRGVSAISVTKSLSSASASSFFRVFGRWGLL